MTKFKEYLKKYCILYWNIQNRKKETEKKKEKGTIKYIKSLPATLIFVNSRQLFPEYLDSYFYPKTECHQRPLQIYPKQLSQINKIKFYLFILFDMIFFIIFNFHYVLTKPLYRENHKKLQNKKLTGSVF